MCTFESRNTFYSPPFTNSDCSFWQSGWERFLFALGAKTALSDHPDIDPWCLGDLEMTSSECESKSQSREPLMWVWGFHLPQIGTPPTTTPCFQHSHVCDRTHFGRRQIALSRGPCLNEHVFSEEDNPGAWMGRRTSGRRRCARMENVVRVAGGPLFFILRAGRRALVNIDSFMVSGEQRRWRKEVLSMSSVYSIIVLKSSLGSNSLDEPHHSQRVGSKDGRHLEPLNLCCSKAGAPGTASYQSVCCVFFQLLASPLKCWEPDLKYPYDF